MLDQQTLETFAQLTEHMARELSRRDEGPTFSEQEIELLRIIRYQLGQLKLLDEERRRRHRELVMTFEQVHRSLQQTEREREGLMDHGANALAKLLDDMGGL